MRYTPLILLVFICLSCSVKPLEQSPQAKTDSAKQVTVVPSKNDTSIYIGFVRSFPETKEYYINLYYSGENVDEKIWRPLLDSVVYKDMEITRQRVPIIEARKFLDISNLDTLWLYNKNHSFTEVVTLRRVEWYDGVLEGGFIAVYKSAMVEFGAPSYGISADENSYSRIHQFSATEISDFALDRTIASHLNIDTTGYKFTHYTLKPLDAIYSSVVSDEKTYITETRGSIVTKLKENDDAELILGLLPLPIEVNGKPALLIFAGLSESDVMWDYLAVWNGSSYAEAQRGRLGRVSY